MAGMPKLPRSGLSLADLKFSNAVTQVLVRATASDEPLFLVGETGTGKSLVAQVVHEVGRRRDGPFLAVNCAALPDTLFEREMFGHVAGAFTDARIASPGYFEAANGGSLFLDEIGELSRSGQAKLLLAVESGIIRRVGSPAPSRIDVRMVAATNGEPERLIQSGALRRDLFYRLSTVVVALPPLRNRRPQLPAIVRSLMNRLVGLEAPTISDEAMEALCAYSWPGNVRELEAVLRHALSFSPSTLSVEHLPFAPRTRRLGIGAGSPAAGQGERDRIAAALRHTNGNRTHAARLLGISRTTLWGKLRESPARTTASAGRTSEAAASVSVPRRPPSAERTLRRLGPEVREASRGLLFNKHDARGRVLLIAVGVAIATVVFFLTDGVLFRGLPYLNSKQIFAVAVERAGPLRSSVPDSVPTIGDWRRRQDLFADVAAYEPGSVTRFETGGGDIVVRTARVTPRFVPMLTGFEPVGWDRPATPDTALLTLLPNMLGRIEAMGVSGTLVGRQFARPSGGHVAVAAVLPQTFTFPFAAVSAPVDALELVADDALPATATGLVLVRISPGVAPSEVEQALRSTFLQPEAWRVSLTELGTRLTRRVRPVAVGAVAACVVLLLGCVANLVNLYLANRAARLREFQTRQALGATPAGIRRMWATEVALEAAVGATLGLAVAIAAIGYLPRVLPELWNVSGFPDSSARTVLFAAVLAWLLAGFSALPAIFSPLQRQSLTIVSGSRLHRKWRFAAVAVQCAVASLLFTAAGLVMSSWTILTGQEIGFDPQVVVTSVSYRPDRGGVALQDDIDSTIGLLGRLPGVQGAGAAVGSMLDRLIFPQSLSIGGTQVGAVARKQVSASYFETVGSRLVAGRVLALTDAGAPVLVVTEAVSRQLGRNPVGEVAQPGNRLIVGVVRDERNRQLDEASPMPTAFELLRNPWQSGCALCGQVTYVVRTSQDSPDLPQLIRRAVQSVNTQAVVYESSSISDRLASTVQDRTFATALLSVFGAAALFIATSGLISVILLAVRQRLKEVGIRIALGATPAQVLRALLADTALAAGAGLAIGWLMSSLVLSVTRHLLYGIGGVAELLIVGAFLIVMLTTLAAMVMPARHVLGLSAARVLRFD